MTQIHDVEKKLDAALRRIDELESRAALHELVTDYCLGFDTRDWDRFIAIWHPDAVWDIGPPFGSFSNLEGIRKAVYEVLYPVWRETHHLTSNLRLVFRDADHAHGICDCDCMGATRDDVVQMMIGRAERISKRAARSKPATAPYLELQDYSSTAGHKDISLAVRPGEILGLYGLVGAGRSELAKAVLGLSGQTGGEIRVAGRHVKINSVAEALALGIGYVSEDRKAEGLILLHSVLANAGITVPQIHGKAPATAAVPIKAH